MLAFPRTVLLAVFLGVPFSHTGEVLKPGKLSKQEQAALQSGLTLRIYHSDALLDARRVRLAALYVGAGEAPSPFVDPGPFKATLTGYLKTSLKGELTFRVTCVGSARLRINGKDVLRADNNAVSTPTPITLVKGYNRIEIDYMSAARGASLRVDWSGASFTTEPLPPELLFTRGDEPELVRGEERRTGRLLYAIHSCARCHALPDGITDHKVVMPELRSERPPLLTGAGRRLQPGWVVRWVQAPRALRPDARMPHVLHGDSAAQQAADLAKYLGSLRDSPALSATAVDPARVPQGERHFATLGCIVCHHFEEPAKADPFGRLSLYYVKAKFQPGALEAFLREPHKHYPWIRMPDFHLDATEAAALAAFLLDRAKGTVAAPLAGDATRGARLFADTGCASCHATGTVASTPKLRPSPDVGVLMKGCLAAAPSAVPDFGLKDAERQAVAAFLNSDGASLKRETPAEFSLRQVKELQCEACHRRDGQPSRWNRILEDEGVMSEFLPSLTWAGEKVKPAWTAKLLAAAHDRRARPWLKARMPGFPARAELLAVGLSHEHGLAVGEDDRPPADAKLAAIGQKLVEQQGGLNCVMCHAIGDRAATAPFEAPGINLRDAVLRLRHNYYPRWMIDPPHVDITTRMPKFSQDGKTTPLRDVLDGDAFRQYEAVWQYIQTLPQK
jgi:mono/diheme cytochrome c family protein